MRIGGLWRGFWPAVLALIALGTWARCADFERVLGSRVELAPTDSHYYVRFARLQLDAFPAFTAFDPWVNFPEGARIVWPPVHTAFVAAAVALFPEDPERGAAWVGPVLSALWMGLFAILGRRRLGELRTVGALLVLALLPVMLQGGGLGNADHHVHEPWLAAVMVLLGMDVVRREGRERALALGALLGASRLLTTSTILYIPCVAGALVVAGLANRAEAARIARASAMVGAAAAGTSALAAVIFGELGSLEYLPISGFGVLAMVLAFSSACALLGWAAGARRLAWFAVPALAAGGLLLPSLIRSSADLAGTDPLLAVVVESQPLWRDPELAFALFGLPLVWTPLAAVGLGVAWWRTRDQGWVVLGVWGLLLGLAASAQLRFTQSWAGAIAVLLVVGLPSLLASLRSRVRVAAGALAGLTIFSLVPGVPARAEAGPPAASDEALTRSTLQWVANNTPPTDDYAVLATHDLGHLITLWAKRPTVSSPFSQAPWHVAGNERAAVVLRAEDDEEAWRQAEATKARYVVVVPFAVILGRDGSPDTATLARRLLEHAALDGGSTGHFRLVYDSPENRRFKPRPFGRVFEVVDGARLVGRAAPGSEVTAQLALTTNRGERLQYVRTAHADASGHFELRLAYPSEPAGEVRADGPYRVVVDGNVWTAHVSEQAVRKGASVHLRLD